MGCFISVPFVSLVIRSSFIRVIKSRRMRWAGHVANIAEMRNAYKILDWKEPHGTARGR
jgi:hypothetical protein